ncbi:MAG: aldehyde dehydrogenase [Methyloligellaceae bacterium]
MFNVQLMIASQNRDASDGQTFDRINPVTGEVATRSASASVADAEAAASAAAAAFPAWSGLGPNQRRDYLLKASELLRERTPGFIERMAQETGATATWAGFNAHLAANMLREAASMTTQISGEIIPSDVPGSLAMGVRKPVGVILSLAPWNAPVILGVRSIAMPLACGNTVVLKASELCPATHQLIAEVMQEAGLPEGVVNFVSNSPENAPEIVKALIAHPAIRRVNFTGSTRVGKIIAALAAENLKPALLELGGKAPVVILDDADIDAAVNAAAFGAFMNQGQICMSTERLVVDEKIADEFVSRLAAKINTLKTGDPSDPEVIIGSVVNEQAVSRIMELIEDAKSKGGKVVTGGSNNGTIVQATILDNVTSSMRIYSEESFGPVVSVIRVNGVDEAVRIANDTEYGLSSAVFGRDISRAMSVADRIESGICHINGPTVHDEAQMPFGGVKASGYGRFGGKAAIDEFTELRWMTIQNGPRHYSF